MRTLEKSDIVLFGELHDNPISHWLQLEVTKALQTSRKLTLGAEMMEADNQSELDLYLHDSINYKELDSTARLWSNFKTDYKPLVDFAKKNALAFVATNIPRRYANMVYKKDFQVLDTLSSKEKAWMAPLPIQFDPDLPTYKEILTMMGDHGSPLLVKAQAMKDATMAHFILANYVSDHLFMHYNGAFHSNKYEGILWYLKQQRPDLKYCTISTVSQGNINQLKKEHKKLADFTICVDEDMTTTY